MPLPSDSVIKALFESYFNMRAENWEIVKDEDGETYKLPEPGTKQGKKVEIITKILAERKNVYAEYTKLVETILEAEAQQDAEFNDRSRALKFFSIVKPPYLADVLRAVRSYIVSTLASDPNYKQMLDAHVGTLEEKLKNLELEDLRLKAHHQSDTAMIAANTAAIARTRIQITAFKNQTRYDIEFFNNKVKTLDPKSAELKESSFEDFVSNAIRKTRNTPICDQITPKPSENRKETRAQQRAKAEDAVAGLAINSILASDTPSKARNPSPPPAANTRPRRTRRNY